MVAVLEWIGNHWMTSILIFFGILFLMEEFFRGMKSLLRYRLKHCQRCCSCADGEGEEKKQS